MNLPFAFSDIRKVVFYKRDELTTDLICCDVEVEGSDGVVICSNHEESTNWAAWVKRLSDLPGFDTDWYAKASLPPFAQCPSVVFERAPLNPPQ